MQLVPTCWSRSLLIRSRLMCRNWQPGEASFYPEEARVDESVIRERQLEPMPLPLKKVAEENGSRLMASTGALAAAGALIGLPLKVVSFPPIR